MKKQSGAFSKMGIAFTLLLAIVVIVSAMMSRQGGDKVTVKHPEDIADYLFWEAKGLTEFKLAGASGSTFGLKDLKGKWSFIFFGYTQCPDVCPLTMGILGQTFKILEKNPAVFQEIQGVFISVDPKRDTPELLKEYVSYFNNKFIGVTGDKEQLDALSRQMSVLYTINSKEPEKTGEAKELKKEEGGVALKKPGGSTSGKEEYTVTHSSTVFLVDPEGRLYGRFPPPQVPQEIAQVFEKIRTFYNEGVKK
jgi:protein SCO1/2